MFVETRGLLDTELIEDLAVRQKDTLQRILVEYDLDFSGDPAPTLGVITYGAMLAHYGLLKHLDGFTLRNAGNLSSVPTEHLSSLVSIVRGCIEIHKGWVMGNVDNVSGKSLVAILDSANCNLSIRSQNLGSEETEALVRAIETRVRRVWVYPM